MVLSIAELVDIGFVLLVGAGDVNYLVALLVDQKLALDALEALSSQAPDAVVTVSTESPLNTHKTL